MKREKFDETMDSELLKNGFAYFEDWQYGPMDGWTTSHEHHTLSLMRHDFGYDLIIGRHASGTNPRMGIGSSNRAMDIVEIRDALKKLW
jgi:hypothetical protein